jgi:hypothetical protein
MSLVLMTLPVKSLNVEESLISSLDASVLDDADGWANKKKGGVGTQ